MHAIQILCPIIRISTVLSLVCRAYCIRHNYRLYGCQKCSLYIQKTEDFGIFSLDSFEFKSHVVPDWKDWCVKKCAQNDGGSACACDYLP